MRKLDTDEAKNMAMRANFYSNISSLGLFNMSRVLRTSIDLPSADHLVRNQMLPDSWPHAVNAAFGMPAFNNVLSAHVAAHSRVSGGSQMPAGY